MKGGLSSNCCSAMLDVLKGLHMPSKGKSLVIALASFGLFILFVNWNVGCLYWPAAIMAVVYGLNWCRKFSRDYRKGRQAIAERYVEYDGFRAPAQKTTPGSGWIGLDGLTNPPESL
jgi:hypothetical protein